MERPHGRVVRWHESSAEENVYLCAPEFADAPGAPVQLSARLIDPPEGHLTADACRRLAARLIDCADFIELT